MLTSNPKSRITRPKLLDPNIVAGNLQRKTSNRLDIQADDSPDRIIDLLARGNQQFVERRAQNIAYNSLALSAAAQGKTPSVAILNYVRLSTPIENIFSQKFGEIFTIDSTQPMPTAREISTLEYAVMILGVKVITILEDELDRSAGALATVNERIPSDNRRQITLEVKHNKIFISNRKIDDLPRDRSTRTRTLHNSPLLQRFIEAGKLKIICGTYNSEHTTVKLLAA